MPACARLRHLTEGRPLLFIYAAMTAQLVIDALVMSIWRRGRPDALLHHSDRVAQDRTNSTKAAPNPGRGQG